jgi:glucosyl-dolichyl phosphate glucuronosyltransferase
MRLTAALCTWNRCALLREALESFTHLSIPDGIEWELVVVNNNSTDDTPSVLDAFRARLPLRTVFVPKQGISPARNAAVDAASGKYILWTDDDVMVDRNWMQAYVAAFRRWPDAALFGGPIRPHFEGNPPQWLVANLPMIRSAFALLDLGPTARQLAPTGSNLPFGANYAALTAVQRLHRFNPEYGKVGALMMFGEESDVMRRILAAASVGWWVPEAVVQHWITKERQTFRYLRSYYEAQGRTRVQFGAGGGPTIWGRPRWLWRELAVTHARYLWRRCARPSRHWIDDFTDAAILRGMFEAYGMPALGKRAGRS